MVGEFGRCWRWGKEGGERKVRKGRWVKGTRNQMGQAKEMSKEELERSPEECSPVHIGMSQFWTGFSTLLVRHQGLL